MQRLCRTRQRQGFVPVAAEVLELRDLLSSGAAAVHGAMHHAAIQQAASPATVPAPRPFHGLASAVFSIDGGLETDLTGKISLSKVNLAVDSKISAHFTFSTTVDGIKATLKGSFVGTVFGSNPISTGTQIGITPTGGSVTLTEKALGLKAKAVPNGTLIELTLDANTKYSTMGETDVFVAGSPLGLGGLTIKVGTAIA
jgi:hypothetical protein